MRIKSGVRMEPEMRVFPTTEGQQIEPKAFASRYWYRCLGVPGIRVRGSHAIKDTFVTKRAGVKVAWLEADGRWLRDVKRHYGKC